MIQFTNQLKLFRIVVVSLRRFKLWFTASMFQVIDDKQQTQYIRFPTALKNTINIMIIFIGLFDAFYFNQIVMGV